MDLAIQDIKQHKGRCLATAIGVGLLFALVLSFNGIYRGFLFEGLSFIKTTNPDLWVVERYRGGPINEESIVPEFFHYSVAAISGVAKASPIIFSPVEREILGKKRRFAIVGYYVFDGLGGPQILVAGRGIRRAHYEMVAHKKLGVKVGDRVPPGPAHLHGGGPDCRGHRPGGGTPGVSLFARCPGSAVSTGQRRNPQPEGTFITESDHPGKLIRPG